MADLGEGDMRGAWLAFWVETLGRGIILESAGKPQLAPSENKVFILLSPCASGEMTDSPFWRLERGSCLGRSPVALVGCDAQTLGGGHSSQSDT